MITERCILWMLQFKEEDGQLKEQEMKVEESATPRGRGGNRGGGYRGVVGQYTVPK